VARWGAGYVGASLPAPMVAPAFEATRTAWANAGREDSPYLVAIAYYAIGDAEQGLANVYDYYSISGEQVARLITDAVATSPTRIKDTVAAFADLGADELILNPTVGNLDEITRLANLVL
jgi:alkanesulfonate monooxygenase SsuD/methylene tetrahydromethanopterin reductase-like flavin-dependent oxidoreductase (luciferase family)